MKEQADEYYSKAIGLCKGDSIKINQVKYFIRDH